MTNNQSADPSEGIVSEVPRAWCEEAPGAHLSGVEHKLVAGGGCVQGYVAPGFESLVDVFIQNFDRGELGAAFTVRQRGRLLVDIWGGKVHKDAQADWSRDTMAVFFSCTKMMSSLVILHLVDRGLLGLDTPLEQVWPELKAAQQGATLRMLLAHTIGLPAVATKLAPNAYDNPGVMAKILAQQDPFWEPGIRVGYQPITFGFLVAELVHRVAGCSIGAYFHKVFAGPLGLDLYLGMPEALYPRVAPIAPYRPGKGEPLSHVAQACKHIGSIQNLWMFNSGGWSIHSINEAAGLAVELPAANGVGTSRGLSALLSLLGDDQALARVGLSPETRARLNHVESATHKDATLLCATRFSLGFMKSIANYHDHLADHFEIGANAFGHVGHGGSFGFYDADAELSAAYIMNQQGPGILLNERGEALITATYTALGFQKTTAGAWLAP